MLQSARQFDAALEIVGKLRAAGYEAYFAGGCVRDLLLGREPKDFDVATSAEPSVVLDMFERTFAVGAQFGVVLVVAEGEDQIVTEVATFRSDGAYSDGRHPDGVRYTKSAEEDVRRRDFTINGLLLDPGKLFPQGLKQGLFEGADVRAKARPLQDSEHPAGAKAPPDLLASSARLKSCPDSSSMASPAGLKSCPDSSSMASPARTKVVP